MISCLPLKTLSQSEYIIAKGVQFEFKHNKDVKTTGGMIFYHRATIFVVLCVRMFLSNSSPKSKVQTSVLRLGVDFVFPLSQQQEQQQKEQEEEPPPKSKLEFDTEDQVLCFSFGS